MPRRSALQGGLRQRQRRLGAKTLWRGIVHRSPPEKIPKVGTTAVFGPFPNFHASNINTLRDQKTRNSPKPGANRLTSANQRGRQRGDCDRRQCRGNRSNSVTYTVAGPAVPTISIANPSLSVTEGGGTVGLGITESPNTPYTGTVVTIQGLPSYETITDKHDQMTFQGNLITLTGTEVNSGLTLTSNYQGAGHPSATLTITGDSIVNGVSSAMSAPQTI